MLKSIIKISSIISLLLLFSFQKVIAQNILLDSLTLDTLKAYTSLQEALKNPELVIKLELRKKKLKEFPVEIFKFPNLQYLDLSKNDIKKIPAEIGQLKNLQYFSISKTGLESLPPQIGELTNLYFLNANQNEISTLPAQIGKLTKLKKLDLWSNNIDKYPNEIKNLVSLQTLDLRVILIPDDEQERVQNLLPRTKIYFSPYCKCQQ
jgi:Leucine-rich repeat (LRR) protein